MSHYRLNKTVAMIGMMGAGKTAIGTALARLIDVRFVDSDQQIETAANLSVAEIFETYGEAFFREKESLVLSRLLDEKPAVLSTGGGAFLEKSNREAISNKGLAIWLNADLDLLWARVKGKNTRPLLRVDNPRAKLASLLSERLPAYECAGLVVDVEPNFSITQMTEKVLQSLLDHPSNCLERID